MESQSSDTFTQLEKLAKNEKRPVVCIQGLGFVGAAMAVAAAAARGARGEPCFTVAGIDLPTKEGRERIAALNRGEFPFRSDDPKMEAAMKRVSSQGNLRALDDVRAYGLADVIVVDIHLDVQDKNGSPNVDFTGFRRAIATIGAHVKEGALVIVETTVPPGTCERVVAPELAAALQKRGMREDSVLIAHSYERVMPGEMYFDSIVNFWRVYSGHSAQAAEACAAFLSKVIDTQKFPLTRLRSTTASEMSKILENSYRATTIAFIEEWGRYAEAVGVDLFETINAIRVRPTHNNIRQPGFGVGGYCLTKDPLFAEVSARALFDRPDLKFPFSVKSIEINEAMPLVSLKKVRELLGGSLKGRQLVLLGASYRPDVGDTRFSPSEVFCREAVKEGASLECYDPLVSYWPELGLTLPKELPPVGKCDAIVVAVGHKEILNIDWKNWLGGARPLVFDANGLLDFNKRRMLRELGCRVESIGRGEGL